MKAYNRQNLAIRAWQIARVEGWRSLIDRVIHRWLHRLHAYLPTGFTSMEDILRWLNEHSYYAVYSFDVFDTLLRRRIDPPELIKRLVAEHMSTLLARRGIYVSPEDILTQRNKVEEALRLTAVSNGKDAECCLDDVITETLKAVKADNVLDSEKIVNYEVGLEKKATEPMTGARAVLTSLHSRGKRVICISDSYLSSNQMATILEHHGLLKYVDKLYVSSDVGRTKATRKLFQYVIENEGSKMVHIGDDYISDNSIPRSLAIRTLWFHSRSEQRRKSELRKLLNSKNKMNYVNAIVRSADRDNNALHRIGYDVLGPTLTVFVHNVAEYVRKDGIEMIFFIARDGYVMKKIYDILRSSIYTDQILPIGKYMCLGRSPVRLASLQRFTYAEASEVYMYAVRSHGKDITFGDVLSSYGLELSHFIRIAKRHQIDIDEPINDPAHDTKLHELLESNGFQKIIEVKSDHARRLLREYLVRIGFMGRRNVAVVDGNAEGVTQSLLDRAFVNDKDYPMVSRYYFNALNLNVNRTGINLDLPQVRGIVSDWRRNSRSEQHPFLLFGLLIELFAHPNHGLTVGYKNVRGKIMPIFRKTSQESQYQITSQVLQGILSYARDYSTYYSLHNYKCEELLEHVKSNMRHWVAFPPKKHVEALKDLFVTVDWPQESSHSLIEQIKIRDIITIGEFVKKVASCGWPEGTLRLAPVPGLNWLFYNIVTRSNQGRRLASHLARL